MRQDNVNQRGFTLVELASIIVIMGSLAALAVPKSLNTAERAKAEEAFRHLSAVQAAQERYRARYGSYAVHVTNLDVELSDLEYFEVAEITTERTGWSLTLARKEPSAGFGAYTIVFNREGFDFAKSTITDHPGITPMRLQSPEQRLPRVAVRPR